MNQRLNITSVNVPGNSRGALPRAAKPARPDSERDESTMKSRLTSCPVGAHAADHIRTRQDESTEPLLTPSKCFRGAPDHVAEVQPLAAKLDLPWWGSSEIQGIHPRGGSGVPSGVQ